MYTLWILICGCFVFFMQAGFTCYEAGFVQSKNVISVAIENIFNLTITIVLYSLLGYRIMFGDMPQNTDEYAFYFLHMMFAATSVTIFAGAISERTKLSALLICGGVSALIIYPVFGRWAWGDMAKGFGGGWLRQMGFVDLAGASVVHMTAGFIALAGLIVVGKRSRMNAGKSNIPLAVLGVFILWFGWFGFNGSSVGPDADEMAFVFINTTLSAAFGTIGALLINLILRKNGGYLISLFNGVLSGLVAITAFSAFCIPPVAMITGFIAGVLSDLASSLMEKLKIDDVVKVVPVHLVGGITGCLMLPLFIDESCLMADTRIEQFGIQAVGIVANFLWAFGISLVTFLILKYTIGLRVTPQEEEKGLNIVEFSDIYSWQNYIEISSYEREIQEKNELLRKQARLLAVTEEQEKKKLARDLHDGVGQSLSALKVILGITKMRSSATGDKIIEENADKASRLADISLKEMRNVLNNLKPEVLENKGLEAGLKDMVLKLDAVSDFECSINIKDPIPSFDETVELNIYRIVQECLTNVVKHANAKKAEVICSLGEKADKEGYYIFIVRDDGNGFDPVAENTGVGIPSMYDRIRMLGGRFDIYSTEGRGTKVVMEVPYK